MTSVARQGKKGPLSGSGAAVARAGRGRSYTGRVGPGTRAILALGLAEAPVQGTPKTTPVVPGRSLWLTHPLVGLPGCGRSNHRKRARGLMRTHG